MKTIEAFTAWADAYSDDLVGHPVELTVEDGIVVAVGYDRDCDERPVGRLGPISHDRAAALVAQYRERRS